MSENEMSALLHLAQKISDEADSWKGDPLPFWNRHSVHTADLAKELINLTGQVNAMRAWLRLHGGTSERQQFAAIFPVPAPETTKKWR